MMKRKLTLISAIAALSFASCSAKASQQLSYSVNATLSPDEDGATAYIINYDNSEKIDSVIVDGGVASFNGAIDTPMLARLIVSGDRYGTFILEQGNITLADKVATGTPLNEKMNKLESDADALVSQYRALPDDSISEPKRKEILDQYNKLFDTTLEQNLDNPIGYYLFLQKGYEMTLAELQQAVDQHPALGNYTRVKKLITAGQNKEKTSVGKKFTDFEVTQPDGKTLRLSDFVGKGKYVLVDFWASWCGPCIRETAVIKDILKEFGPKGLEVLGVAVWDEPDNTLAAIKKHELPWPQILNAQTIPTDIYGISGIPCIILFSPDGTIISRDKQDAELKAAVRDALK